jgi:hypothetical protein
VLRTLFGKLRLDSPRLYRCERCSKEEYRSFSPLAELLTDRTAPELAYLENKVCSYGPGCCPFQLGVTVSVSASETFLLEQCPGVVYYGLVETTG